MQGFRLRSGEKILLIGDSITDCGRRDQYPPLGNGYVSIAANLVTARYPEGEVVWVNRGIGGDVVEGLAKRWTEDVIAEKPDWISVAIGINDVARDRTAHRDLAESLGDYEKHYRQILSRSRLETSAQLILLEVFYLGQDDQARRGFQVDQYNEVVHRLAAEYGAVLVPIASAFDRASSARPGFAWTTGDGVHPLPAGHTLMALKFLEALDW